MKDTTKKFFGRLGEFAMYTLVPPAIVASGCWLAFGVPAIAPSFLCALGLDLIVGFGVNGYQTVKLEKVKAELTMAQMDYERGHLVGVSCASCGARNIVPLDLTIDGFECDNCHSKNKLYYEFRASTIMDLDREKVMEVARKRMQEEAIDNRNEAWDRAEALLK